MWPWNDSAIKQNYYIIFSPSKYNKNNYKQIKNFKVLSLKLTPNSCKFWFNKLLL